MWLTENTESKCEYHVIVIPFIYKHKWGPDGFLYDCIADCTSKIQTDCCIINPRTKHMEFSDKFGNVRELMNDKDREKVKQIILAQKDKNDHEVIDFDKDNIKRALNTDEKALFKRYQEQKDLIPMKEICDNEKKCFTVKGSDFFISNNIMFSNKPET